jgi:hypothetical protein
MEIENGNEYNSSQTISEITTYSANVKLASQSEEENLSTRKITSCSTTDAPTKLSRRSRRLKRLVKPCSVKIFKMNFHLY